MPADKSQQSTVQTYAGVLAAAGFISPSPNNPERNYLEIQNQGLNPMKVRFGAPVTTDGFYITIAAGASRIWDTKVIIQSINLLSDLGTTWVILEGREPR